MHNAICYNKRATCDKGELLTEPPSLLLELLTEPLRLLLECICVEVNKQTTVCFTPPSFEACTLKLSIYKTV